MSDQKSKPVVKAKPIVPEVHVPEYPEIVSDSDEASQRHTDEELIEDGAASVRSTL